MWSWVKIYTIYTGDHGSQRKWGAILFFIVKNPTWVGKKGTFGSPVDELDRSQALCKYLHIYKTQSGLLNIVTYIQLMHQVNICTYVHNRSKQVIYVQRT